MVKDMQCSCGLSFMPVDWIQNRLEGFCSKKCKENAMNREQMLIEMLEIADKQIHELQLRADFLYKEVAQLRERITYLEPQIYGGNTK